MNIREEGWYIGVSTAIGGGFVLTGGVCLSENGEMN